MVPTVPGYIIPRETQGGRAASQSELPLGWNGLLPMVVQEKLIAAADSPYTIVHATQFFLRLQ